MTNNTDASSAQTNIDDYKQHLLVKHKAWPGGLLIMSACYGYIAQGNNTSLLPAGVFSGFAVYDMFYGKIDTARQKASTLQRVCLSTGMAAGSLTRSILNWMNPETVLATQLCPDDFNLTDYLTFDGEDPMPRP